MAIPASELIYNPDGSIYHLALLPEQVAPTIFLVGDPGRVEKVSRHFDAIEHRVSRREFVTHTGRIGQMPLTVISTGIGTDNIDIVLNELDALFNIDPHTRQASRHHQKLRLIRLGTSGAVQASIDPGDVILTAMAVGLDNLMHFYDCASLRAVELEEALEAFSRDRFSWPVQPYAFGTHSSLIDSMGGIWRRGITMTLPGFYGPQGRQLRGRISDERIWQALPAFTWQGLSITNFEMESSGIYGLAALLGHEALSVNLILANRRAGTFLSSYEKALQSMIERVLSNIPGPVTT